MGDRDNGANGLHGDGTTWGDDGHTNGESPAADDDGLPRLALPHLQLGTLEWGVHC